MLGSQHICWLKKASQTEHYPHVLPAGALPFMSLVGLIPSEIIVHLFGRTSAKSIYFLLSGE